MTLLKTSRRQFMRLGVALLSWCVLEPWVWETRWLKIKKLNIGGSKASHRIVHITDIHHKGDRAYLTKVVETVNALSPDFVCFTGDLVEESVHLDEALDLMSQIRYPVYAVPGNHDFASRASFDKIAQFCQSTGGAWLLNKDRITKDGRLQIVGSMGFDHLPPLKQELKRLLLVHYPLYVNEVKGTFDLVLAGHSHGGQVRIPFWGPLVLPDNVGSYDMGLFKTQSGLLYVNPGIGTYHLPVRAWCRPEITVISL